MSEYSQNFGSILKEARERAGFDVNTLARRLHIRADILLTIEEADFANMPASGYTRNMIRSYARSVGVNQNEISAQYLSELKAYERATSKTHDSDYLEVRNNPKSQQQRYRNNGGSGNRRTYADDRRYNNRTPDYSDDRFSSRTSRSSSINGNTQKSSSSSISDRVINGRRERTTKSMSATPSLGKMPLLKNASLQNINKQSVIAVISVAVILILVIVICVMVFGPKNSDVEELPAMPISGLTDTSNKADESTNSTTTRETTKATFEFSVETGEKSWITVVNGDETVYAGVATSETKSFDVTSTLTFTTANPTPVTCKVDGKEVELTKSGTNYTYTLNFEEYKAEKDAASNSTTSGSATSNSSGSSNASSTSSGSGTSSGTSSTNSTSSSSSSGSSSNRSSTQ